MNEQFQPPWASGPGEILKHGLTLLQNDSDVNRRLAMLSIDNAVELMIKTFLGLPSRITGLNISRQQYQQSSESFPKLLDLLEKFASNILDGINLGEIEWYHRLRNELYHQGNGLTVERRKVEMYSELAKLLFNNLFEEELLPPEEDSRDLYGEFIRSWSELEKSIYKILPGEKKIGIPSLFREAVIRKILSEKEFNQLQSLRNLRNKVVHGMLEDESVVTKDTIELIKEITEKMSERN